MRAVKLALFSVLVAAWVVGWNHRAFVTSAYTEDRDPIEVQLQGLDQTDTARVPSPSPFGLSRVDAKPPLSLGFQAPPPVTVEVAMFGGSASLAGIVLDEFGEPVSDAVVRIQRITSSGETAIDVRTDGEGSWSLTELLGGRFRTRAFVPGTLHSLGSEVTALEPGGADEFPVRVATPSEAIQIHLVGPEKIGLGLDDTVAITAGRQVVDGDGILVEVASPGLLITVTVEGAAGVISADQLLTDSGGAARFLISCADLGASTMTVATEQTLLDDDDESSARVVSILELPRCVPLAELIADEEARAEEEGL